MDGEKQKEMFFKKLSVEDSGNISITAKGFANEIILPIIKWIIAKTKPG